MNKKMKLLRNRLIAVLLAVVITGGLLYALSVIAPAAPAAPVPTATKAPAATAAPAVKKAEDIMHIGEIEAIVNKQSETDAELLRVLESGEYTLDDPYVQLDPYGESPLTAIAVFDTAAPCRISVHVQGDTPKANVDFAFGDYATSHAVPILGLYPDRINTVTLTATGLDGAEKQTTLELATEGLPDFFEGFALIAETLDEANYADGFNFPSGVQLCVNYPFAFDCNGAIRWYLPNYTSNMEFFFFRDVEEGFIIARGNLLGDTTLATISILGKVFDYYFTEYGSQHDLYQTSHNSWVITGNNQYNKATMEDLLYEISTTDGSILHMLDFRFILERTRLYGDEGHSGNLDWLHMNSVVEYQDDVMISSNFQSLVMRISWDGQIQWMLTDPSGYLEMYEQYMLRPVGESFEWPYNQHAIQLLPDQDGNEDTVDIFLFDNGASRSAVDDQVDKNYSRMVQYRIDEKNMTVEQIWSYGEDRLELYAPWRGDANILDNGNALGTFDVLHAGSVESRHGVYLEVTRSGELVWQCLGQSLLEDNQYRPYRCERMPVYTRNILDLRLGSVPRVIIPEKIWEKYGIDAFHTETETASAVPEPPAATAEPAAETSDSVWSITVESAELFKTLHTDTDVLQYEGSYQTVTYDNAPADGMQFALFDLTVRKTQASKSTFDWAGLQLVLADGSAYARAEDVYLSNHGYKRISGTKLSLSPAAGYACFEIPDTASLDGAALQYTADSGSARFEIP